MDRRHFITTVGATSTIAIAGCTDNNETGNSDNSDNSDNSEGEPLDNDDNDVTDDEPDNLRGVYLPDHTDEMNMIGKQTTDNGLTVALSYAAPHNFTLVTGPQTQPVEIAPDDAMHIMVSVWDNNTLLTPPQAEPAVTIYRDDEELTTVNPWPMLSQSMGYHFGDNVKVRGEGDYRFEIDVNADNSAMPDELATVFSESTLTFEKTFDPFTGRDLGEMPTENAGDPGAVPPMQMGMMTVTQQPAYDDIPIELTDPQYTNDAAIAVGTHDGPSTFDSDTDQYLVVATQTRYNRYLLPLMSATATVERDDEILYEGDIQSSLHPDLGHFYGAGVPELQSGDTVTIETNAPPQTSRHIGYEEAFLNMQPLEFTL